MSLYVKKFGGSSVATPEKMLNIANRVLRDRKPGDKIVIVVSAMGDTTDDLLALASKVSDINHGREMDMLLATGEQISISLMAMTFRKSKYMIRCFAVTVSIFFGLIVLFNRIVYRVLQT